MTKQFPKHSDYLIAKSNDSGKLDYRDLWNVLQHHQQDYQDDQSDRRYLSGSPKSRRVYGGYPHEQVLDPSIKMTKQFPKHSDYLIAKSNDSGKLDYRDLCSSRVLTPIRLAAKVLAGATHRRWAVH
jgi:hypothetical protein